MARTKSKPEEIIPATPAALGTMKIDFANDDGTVDEWVYDTHRYPFRVKQVTVGIRRSKPVAG